jgi:hypothetical protein
LKKLVILLLTCGLSASAAAGPIFRNPLPFPFPTGGFWNFIKADFDGNGYTDVLVTSIDEDSELVVHLSNGSGPFAPPVTTPAPGNKNPGIGDFNGDGKIDVVVPSVAQKLVTVMLGNGDGTFLAGSAFSTVYEPHTILAGRFNGDQHLDLVVAMTLSSNRFVYVYFGDGTGHFSGGLATNITQSLLHYPPVDLNGDNKTDLIGESRVFLGDGAGGFTTMPTTAIGTDVVVDDFNHDGKRDLASVSGSSYNEVVWVSLGNGDGTFQSTVSYRAGHAYQSMDVSDLNGDGHADLLVSGSTGSSTVGVLLGKGDGTFHPVELWLSNASPFMILADDFDRDGKVDFVTAIDEELRALSFVRGNGDGTFATYRAFRPGTYVWYGVPTDMNGDGKQDVVALQEHEGQPWDLAVLLNDGSGKLAAPILSPSGAGGQYGPALAIGDLNNDSESDAVVVESSYAGSVYRALLGNGDGTFAAPVVFSIPATGRIKLGHFNGDSNLDLYVDDLWHFATVFPGLGNGTFGAGIQSSIFGGWLFGDLNGDGVLDVVTETSLYKRVGINDGSGQFTPHPLGQDDAPRALGDFNGDQKLDLLSTTYSGTQVRLGNGDGTFGAPLNVAMLPEVSSYSHNEPVTVADFDGDGKMDASIGLSVFLGNGDGTFRARARFRTFDVDFAHAADMDGNGSPDLVATRQSGDIHVLLTRTTNDPTAPSSITVSADKNVAAYAEPVTFTATVTGGAVALSGNVTFALDGVPIAIIAVEEGQATFKSPFAVGAHTITATYHDENYLSSTASTGLTITKAKTAVTISGSPNPQAQGFTVTITAKLTVVEGAGFPYPTGTMTLRNGETPLPVTLINGRASINTLLKGSHVISVDYPGDSNYESSTASFTQIITNPLPIIRMQFTPSVVMANSPATFSVDFPWSSNVTGSITFSVDGTPHSVVTLVNGAATFQRSFAWGFHTVTAHYSGDDAWGETETNVGFNAHIGSWGTPIVIDAQRLDFSSVVVRFSRIVGAVSYTLWRKTTFTDPWQLVSIASPNGSWEFNFTSTIGAAKSALFAVTATNNSGSVAPMSAPDLATTVIFTDDLVPNFTTVKAQQLIELRLAIGAVRTFAGLVAFSYSSTIAAGQPIRAADMQEMRTALAQARTAIAFPAVAFTDPTLTPSTSVIRAAHVAELRAGTN